VFVVIHRHALTSLREARGLTKKQLCELAEISPSYLTELEAGDKPGSPQIAKRLADALAVNPLALLNPTVADKAVEEMKAEVA
jgi:transcriptional regulator with XRE-family HTH domain